jgi:hypothetical protein
MQKLIWAAAAMFALAGTSAQATTLDLTSSVNNSGGASYWTATTDFVLPAGFSNAVLNITDFEVDDRGIVQLNGTTIDTAGIFGPGNGSFVFTSGGPNDPFTFAGNGARDIDITSGFLVGSNELLFIINDTGDGIFGNLTNGSNGPAGPTGYGFIATLTFDEPAQGVPEPGTWAMMLLGFGAIGATVRLRRARTLATA